MLKVLTITTHSGGNAFFKSTILTTIAINSQYVTLLVFGARSILDFLLDGSSKESL